MKSVTKLIGGIVAEQIEVCISKMVGYKGILMTLKLIYQWLIRLFQMDVGLSFPKSVGSLIGGSATHLDRCIFIGCYRRFVGDEEMQVVVNLVNYSSSHTIFIIGA